MAIDLTVQYPGQVNAATLDYPQGEPRNVSASGAGDGTPWEQAITRDQIGFLQGLLDEAGIIPSGNPDTAVASQYRDALKVILLTRAELASNGGDILEIGDRFTTGFISGLQTVRDSGVLVTTGIGSARNQADTADLIALAGLQKNISLTWVAGAGGGLPAALTPGTAGWFRNFIVGKPDGTTDFVWDTSPTAANFFLDPNAIAAGFSDVSLYRRYGWTRITTAVIPNFENSPDDPRRIIWDVPVQGFASTGVLVASRSAIALTNFAPPSVYAEISACVDFVIGTEAFLLLTTATQSDTAPSSTIFTLRGIGNSSNQSMVNMHINLDSASTFFARRTNNTLEADGFVTNVIGWYDSALIA